MNDYKNIYYKQSYLNYDANEGVKDYQAASSLVLGAANCVENAPLCVLNGLVDAVGQGFAFNNSEQNRNLVRQQLADQDYMIQQGYSFEEWAAKTKQGIITTVLQGQLTTTRLSQKSDLYITSLLRNYYINKTQNLKNQNAAQISKWKGVIITGVILVFLLGTAIFLTEEV